MKQTLLVGTGKGLVIWSGQGNHWSLDTVALEGLPVSMLYVDERTGTWWAGVSHRHWGEKLHFSKDKGSHWYEASLPSYKGYSYRPDKPASLRKIWTMQHAGADRPGALWLGTEPGGLFYTADEGKTFSLVESLWNHPSRMDDKQWFGAGKDFPFIHSIVVDPRDSNHVYIGISCAGIFETRDGGKSWQPRNKGLKAAYLPNPTAEMGHDPHRLLQCHANPAVLWQQNHCGIFRSEDEGRNWTDVSGANSFPCYGFALSIDELNPNRAWVVPAQSDENRIPVDLHLCVCRTNDAGQTWERLTTGLPGGISFDLVLRHAMVREQQTLAFGTTNGNLYVSPNDGDEWLTLHQNLAGINTVVWA